MGQVLATGSAAIVFVALLGSLEAATRHWRIGREDSRRIAHTTAALVAASLPAFMAFGSVVVLAAGFVAFMTFSKRIDLFPSVHGVDRTTLGEVYFPVGVALTAVLFPDRLAYAYGLLVMGVSDPAASFAGQRHGRRGYRVFGASKTWLGSGAFLTTTVVIGIVAMGIGGESAPGAVARGALAAMVLTIVEGVSAGGVDNALLPVAGAALLAWLT